MRSKKGFIFFNIFLTLIALGVLVSAFYVMTAKRIDLASEPLGSYQFEILKLSFTAEMAMGNLNTIAKVTAWQTIDILGAQGGKATKETLYQGLTVYTGESFPNFLKEFETLFNQHMKKNVQKTVYLKPLENSQFFISTKDTHLLGTAPLPIGPDNHKVPASFNVNINYNLEDYLQVQDFITSIIKTCAGNDDEEELQQCIKNYPGATFEVLYSPCDGSSVEQTSPRHYPFCLRNRKVRIPKFGAQTYFSAFPEIQFAIHFKIQAPLAIRYFTIEGTDEPLYLSSYIPRRINAEISTDDPDATIIEFCAPECQQIPEDALTKNPSSITVNYQTPIEESEESFLAYIRFKTPTADYISSPKIRISTSYEQ